MTSPRTSQGSRPPFRRGGRRRRQCFCKENTVDYKDVSSIRRFITDRGRIEAGKKSGNCAKCQRNLTTAIKRARHLALLPFAPDHLRVTGSVASSTRISDDEEETPEDGENIEAPEDTAEAESETDESSTEPESEGHAEDVSNGDADTPDEVAETLESRGDDTETDADADASSTDAPEDTVEAEIDVDDSTTEAESEEPSEDVSTTEPETEAEPEAEASADEEDK